MSRPPDSTINKHCKPKSTGRNSGLNFDSTNLLYPVTDSGYDLMVESPVSQVRAHHVMNDAFCTGVW